MPDKAMAAMQQFLDDLPTQPKTVWKFISSPESFAAFNVLRDPVVHNVLQSYPAVCILLENLEELTLYWYERLHNGGSIGDLTFSKLCDLFRVASTIKVSRLEPS
eukprot:JP447168.1.p1 GENE.JP447168.1~~JP447168.1.p1  ORF type:complete len:116 (-),score=17.80 JP447168.1:336-650(-)